MAICGSIQSSDCLITVEPSNTLEITIESTVIESFGDAIRSVVVDTLKRLDMPTLYVHISDKGAFDHVIRARLICAIERMRKT